MAWNGNMGSEAINMVAMNLSGRFTGKEIRTLGQTVLSTILVEKNIGVLFGQQMNFRPKLPMNYELIGATKAFLAYDKNVFRALDDKEFRHKLKALQLLGKLPFHYLPEKNYVIAKLQKKGSSDVEFIVVSWVTDECQNRQKGIVALKKLCTFLVNLAAIEELPVVVAGTFRISLEDIKESLPYELLCHGYHPSNARRAIRASDFYICSRGVSLSGVQPMPCASMELEMEEAADVQTDRWLNPEDAFYCDPVIAALNVYRDGDADNEQDDTAVVDGPSKLPQAQASPDIITPDTGLSNRIAIARKASSLQNLYDEEIMDNTLLCRLS